MTTEQTSVDSLIEQVASALEGVVSRYVPLGPLCTYKVGGAAELFVDADSVDHLLAVAKALGQLDPLRALPLLVVGKGSNLLVSDHGFKGLVIHLSDDFGSIEIDNQSGRVVAGAMALLPVVARRSVAAGLAGFEWAVGVPGTMGGAAVMNAGGHGSDMASTMVSVGLIDLWDPSGSTRFEADDLDLGYRRSSISAGQVVYEVELQLDRGDQEQSKKLLSDIVAWRRANQPGGQNAGSVFANPQGDSAGRLIDSLGLKGYRIGSAEVSTKHANFIQADPDGSADDVYSVMVEVQRQVFVATGVLLSPENRVIGFDHLPEQLLRSQGYVR